MGRYNNFVIFTPYTAPGDVARVRILNHKKSYAEAELISIEAPSSSRVNPPCPVFMKCGGCQWQHVTYQEQLKQKQLIVEHALNRIAHESDIEILPIIPSPQEFHYRNRAQFRAEGKTVGFYQKKSHNIIEFEKCLIIDEKLNEELAKIKNERINTPSEKTDKIEVFLSQKNAVIRSLNHAHGEESGFSQVNTQQNEQMLKYVADLLGTPGQIATDNSFAGNLLDLYCGNGNFSLPLNKKGWRIHGIDNNRSAIQAARETASQSAFFSPEDCTLGVTKLASQNRKFEVILIDPPRVGADERIWTSLAKLAAPKIVYVSCNPTTFARDWARLKQTAPYKLISIQPFDMFPQTFHVELVATAVLQK